MSEEMGNLVGDSSIITKIPGVERWYIKLLKNQTLYDLVIRLQNHVLMRLRFKICMLQNHCLTNCPSIIFFL